MREVQKDALNAMINISILIQENPEYIVKTIYDLEIRRGKVQILNCKNIFENVSPQYICLKIVHNISMMGSFLKKYVSQTGANFSSPPSRNKDLYVKFLISAEKVDILNKKGFGLLIYNVDDFAYSLYKFNEAFKSFLFLKTNEKEYEYLKLILNDWESYSYTDPNTAMMSLISKNSKFYKKYIEKIENQ